MQTNTHFLSYLVQFFLLLRNLSDKSCRENRNTNFMLIFFFESRAFLDNVEKFCTAGQAIDDSMAHAHCVQYT